MILLIDNYDSFVYNLARYLDELGCETDVRRNDAVTVGEVRDLAPQAIVISPGPCTPTQSGVSVDLVRELGCEIPLLGVCLGHQAIAQALGADVVRAPQPMHGRTSLIHHAKSELFAGLPTPFPATRYHSLTVEAASLPPDLVVTARSDDGLVMAIEHREWPVYGVQFHPESVLTVDGHRLLANFLRLAGLAPGDLPRGDRPIAPPPADDFFQQPGAVSPPLPHGRRAGRS